MRPRSHAEATAGRVLEVVVGRDKKHKQHFFFCCWGFFLNPLPLPLSLSRFLSVSSSEGTLSVQVCSVQRVLGCTVILMNY